MSEVLFLNLHREFFAAIADGTKRIEYRKQTAYWRARLEGRKYDLINFRNGYSPTAPEMLVQFRGLRRYGSGRSAYYAIRLGKILKSRDGDARSTPMAEVPSIATFCWIALEADPKLS